MPLGPGPIRPRTNHDLTPDGSIRTTSPRTFASASTHRATRGFAAATLASVSATASAFGLALISTLQQRRDDFHNARLEESVRANSVIVQDRIDAMVGNGGPEAVRQALRGVKQMISAQATVMSFSDLYIVFGWILLAVLPLVLFLRPPPKSGAAMH